MHEIAIQAPSEVVFDHFVSDVWWGGGGLGVPGVINQGNSKNLEGSVRSVRGGLHESIIGTDYGKYIEYTVSRNPFYFFPVTKHLGRVNFETGSIESKPTTKILWRVRYTPLFGCNIIVYLMVSLLSICLSHLKSECEKDTK